MKIAFKVWLEENDEKVFGEGLYILLSMVAQKGSLNQAAAALQMSYRQAWGQVRKAEARLGDKLLITQTGGALGGGATLTDRARALMAQYLAVKKSVEEVVKEKERD